MAKNADTTEYETPRIEDHGDLTELTAAVGTHGSFDAEFKKGQHIPPNYGTQP
jgi:hypothetical protein